jgi:hypothetical protein
MLSLSSDSVHSQDSQQARERDSHLIGSSSNVGSIINIDDAGVAPAHTADS